MTFVIIVTLTGKVKMYPQLESLRKDCRELQHAIYRAEKKGDSVKAMKTTKKLQFLNDRIQDMEEM
jgi:hypothetical protein